MRHFFHAYWKVIVALILLIVAAALFMRPEPASAAPGLAERLRGHVEAIAPDEDGARAHAMVYIETALARAGYTPLRRDYTAGERRIANIEASVGQVERGKRPERVFVVGASGMGSGTAAVLELARLLATVRPGAGTEVRFVFFTHPDAPADRNFIAFAGSTASSNLVREALAVLRLAPEVPEHGLAALAHTIGVTLSDRAADGYPALMITDTAFLRYPYHLTQQGIANEPDYESMARVVNGLAQTIAALAGAARG
jgi:hypothetical protein